MLEAVDGVGLVAQVVAGEVEQVAGDGPVSDVEVAEQREREGLAGAAPRVGGDRQCGEVRVERPGHGLAEPGLRGAEPLEARQDGVVGEQPPGDAAEQGGLGEHRGRCERSRSAHAGTGLARRDDPGRAQPETVREPTPQLVWRAQARLARRPHGVLLGRRDHLLLRWSLEGEERGRGRVIRPGGW